jgi:hypothetical protein
MTMKESSSNNRSIPPAIAGRCLIVFLIIIGLASFGTVWLVTKVAVIHQEKLAEKEAQKREKEIGNFNWDNISAKLVAKFDGKIRSIEQLNSMTCWAVLSSDISNEEAARLAENIGNYIMRLTGGKKGGKPPVHVFINGKHVAVAKPSGMDYTGKVSLQDWGP